eukprot:365478-Chlamydomonas_euryale.AAC.11
MANKWACGGSCKAVMAAVECCALAVCWMGPRHGNATVGRRIDAAAPLPSVFQELCQHPAAARVTRHGPYSPP